MKQNANNAGGVMLSAASRAASTRWISALKSAADTQGEHYERVIQLERRYVRHLVGAGMAVGVGSAVPGAGVTTFLGLSAAELAWTTTRSAELIMAVGAVYGFTDAGVDERRNWILAVMADGDGAAVQFAQLAGNASRTSMSNRLKGRGLRWANSFLSKRFLARYGSSRALAAAGKALPFGIGAAMGGASNYAVARTVTRQARELFESIAPPPLALPLGPSPLPPGSQAEHQPGPPRIPPPPR